MAAFRVTLRFNMGENTRDWHCEYVSVSDTADGFEVLFENSPDGDREYLLIQRHFEPPDNGECYIETAEPAFCGHYRLRNAQLSRNRFRISFGDAPLKEVVVSFKATESDYAEAKRVLHIMVPNLDLT